MSAGGVQGHRGLKGWLACPLQRELMEGFASLGCRLRDLGLPSTLGASVLLTSGREWARWHLRVTLGAVPETVCVCMNTNLCVGVTSSPGSGLLHLVCVCTACGPDGAEAE